MSRIRQAEQEYEHLVGKLRKAMVAVQTMRINEALQSDVADVRTEVDFLLKTGRIRTASGLLQLVESVSTAKINLDYVRKPEAQHYEAVVEAVEDTEAISYLKDGS